MLALRLLARDLRRDWPAVALCAALIAPAISLGMLFLGASLPRGAAPALRVRVAVTGAFTDAGRGEPATPRVRRSSGSEVILQGAGRRVTLSLKPNRANLDLERPSGLLEADVPQGSRVGTYRQVVVQLVGDERAAKVVLGDPDLRSHVTDLRIVSGRTPQGPGEIAVGVQTAKRLRLSLGKTAGELGGASPTRRTVRVVGLLRGRDSSSLSDGQSEAVGSPGELAGASDGWRVWLVDLPRAANPLQGNTGNGGGGALVSYSLNGPSSTTTSFGNVLLTLPLFVMEAIVLAIPLFLTVATLAIGLHRRARERRLLELAGAGPAILRAIALARGLLLALLASALAYGLSRAAIHAFSLDATLGPLAIALPAAIAGLGAMVASLSATRTARRLSGDPSARRPPDPRAIARSLAAGILWLVAAGLDIALATVSWVPSPLRVVAGLSAIALAMGALWALARCLVAAPSVLRAPPALRPSLRAVGRLRWVSAPAATAVAISAIAVLVVISSATGTTTSGGPRVPDRSVAMIGPDVLSTRGGRQIAPVTTVRGIFAGLPARLDPLHALRWSDGRAVVAIQGAPVRVYLADAATSRALGLAPGSGAGDRLTIFGAGGTGPVMLSRQSADGSTAPFLHLIPARHVRTSLPAGAPSMLAGPALAARLGLVVDPAPTWLARFDRPFDAEQAGRLADRAAAAGLAFTTDGEIVRHSAGGLARVQIALLAVLVALAISSIASALVAVERREEARRMLLLGTRNRDYRLGFALSAFTVSAVGVGIALLVVVALLAVFASRGSLQRPLDDALVTFLPLLGVPPSVALGAFLCARPPQTLGRFGRVPRDAADVRA